MLPELRYRDFCTKNACYTLHYGNHLAITNPPDLEKYDAIVLESGTGHYDSVYIYPSLKRVKQYREIIRKNELLLDDFPRPIFFVDVPPKYSRKDPFSLLYFSSEYFQIASIILLLSLFDTKIALIYSLLLPLPSLLAFKPTGKISSKLLLPYFYTPTAFRSAIAAKKIEEFIVPELRERYKVEKPRIFIDYGAGHSDLEEYLKHKRLRDFVINFGNFNPLVRWILDEKYINKVGEIRSINSPEPSPFAEKLIINREKLKDFELILYKIKL